MLTCPKCGNTLEPTLQICPFCAAIPEKQGQSGKRPNPMARFFTSVTTGGILATILAAVAVGIVLLALFA